ncbi:MAG: cyclic di-3',5'-guanylate-activated glycosyltransferase NrfB [Rouxiella aceris]|uniref:cyclic di-3',5'-guanylate-activated glycosyltransferase NfrB n=1 Tax=Rouxiella aceris TaxID=2703884 RepID=UPI00283B778C|nr:cyclic di-3',5'-guanylate-activated glycosyltransferase NrfB [Rouxiella aceris]MDR3431244.1 cyclic di-3',5'-guanylate-activated glycosyltransferase NrfB [Rouxiella aceris]
MWPTIDLFTSYLFGLKYIAIVLSVMMLISGIDDLFIDIIYWCRRVWRTMTVYQRHAHLDHQALYQPEEKPLAIMIPAWHETGVIGPMAELAASTLDYENYHIFVGTYPNDPDTQRDVDEVCARFPNVHKVVCARPGPTSKADCLNNVLDAILQFERSANFTFDGFILHDAEDVISKMELRLFNYLVARKDLIQIPVYPFERNWKNFTSLSYIDEFAELHGKDVPVREALAGQVPSAGVGTCFSRRAILALLVDGDGIAFDVQSLTEDYDIGFRLKKKGMSEIFVRFPVMPDAPNKKMALGQNARSLNVICVREYFPDTVSTAVRQKSRWVIGIVFQGFKTHKWSDDIALNYFLWRDRKGAMTNFLSFGAMLLMIQLVLLQIYQYLWDDPWYFLSIFAGGPWLVTLLWINFCLMVNRIVQRIIFVTAYYGLAQGLLSVVRLFWGNLINFMANWRAIRQVIQHGDPRRVAWDKTTHDFPAIDDINRARRPLGQILVAQKSLTPQGLEQALSHPIQGLKLGGMLVYTGVITPWQLAQAVAEQSNVEAEELDAWQLDPALIARIPADVALHYAILPLREEHGQLVLASESDIDPVSLAAIGRKLICSVRYVIVPRGQVVVGLRHWYLDQTESKHRQQLDKAILCGFLDQHQAEELWRFYTSRQFLFAEVLLSLGDIGNAAMKSILLRFERSQGSLGEFLVAQSIISAATLDRALDLQQKLQVTMDDVLQAGGLTKMQLSQLKGSTL